MLLSLNVLHSFPPEYFCDVSNLHSGEPHQPGKGERKIWKNKHVSLNVFWTSNFSLLILSRCASQYAFLRLFMWVNPHPGLSSSKWCLPVSLFLALVTWGMFSFETIMKSLHLISWSPKGDSGMFLRSSNTWALKSFFFFLICLFGCWVSAAVCRIFSWACGI